MGGGYLPFAFLALWLIFASFTLVGFHFVHSLFMVLKENDYELWEEYGKPRCKLSFPLDQGKMSLSLTVVFKLYAWGVKAPSWAIATEEGKKVYFRFRIYFLVGVLLGVGVLFILPFFVSVVGA